MKKVQTAIIFLKEHLIISLLTIVVIVISLSSNVAIKNIATGTKSNVYNEFISFYPHIKITVHSSEQSSQICNIFNKITNQIIRVKRIRPKILFNQVKPDSVPISPVVYVLGLDRNNNYLDAILPNLYYGVSDSILSRNDQRSILSSLHIDSVLIDIFRGVDYLPAIILGEDIARKIHVMGFDREYGKRQIIKLSLNGKTEKYWIAGVLLSKNPILSNICLIDSLYSLQPQPNETQFSESIFIQFKDPFKAGKILATVKKSNENLFKSIPDDDIELWSRHTFLKNILLILNKINNGFNFIIFLTNVLASIAIISLMAIIIIYKAKEISIFMSLGYGHRDIFHVFLIIDVILFIIGAVFSVLVLQLTSIIFSSMSFGSQIPYAASTRNLVSFLVISFVLIIINLLITYTGMILRKKSIIEIYST